MQNQNPKGQQKVKVQLTATYGILETQEYRPDLWQSQRNSQLASVRLFY